MTSPGMIPPAPDDSTFPDPHHEGDVIVAPARLRDIRAVGRIQRRAFKPRLAYSSGTLLMLWALPSVQFLVARRETEVLGCALGDRHQGQARVVNLAVDPIARRQGIGRALLAALEEVLPDGDAVLMVEEQNAAARALYAASGYAEIRLARDYYGRGQHGVWMEKRRTGQAAPVVRV